VSASVAVSCADMPFPCHAVKAWATMATLRPREAVFRAIDKGQRITTRRPTGRSVSRIIKIPKLSARRHLGILLSQSQNMVNLGSWTEKGECNSSVHVRAHVNRCRAHLAGLAIHWRSALLAHSALDGAQAAVRWVTTARQLGP
jgi:hypothetical protein